MTLPYKAKGWKTEPISPVCQVSIQSNPPSVLNLVLCGKPTTICYPAYGHGWMALCEHHGKQHLPHAFRIGDLIKSGERFE